MKFRINHIFFIIGLLFCGVFIHEFIHYLQCGGDFIAGFYLIENKFGFGITYCEEGDASELLAYLGFFIFVTPIIIYNIFKDKIA
jgi:hypothetical protein